MLITPEQKPVMALELVFDELEKAPNDRNSPLRLFSISTVDPKHNAPKNRMVVLRHFCEDRSFEFYTDFRSSKVEQLQINSAISALFWDQGKRVQIRFNGRAEVHHQTEHSKSRWNNIHGSAKKDYGAILSPGTPISHSGEAQQWDHETAAQNFSVIRFIPSKVEVLQIGRDAHLSLHFTHSDETKSWIGGWQVP